LPLRAVAGFGGAAAGARIAPGILATISIPC